MLNFRYVIIVIKFSISMNVFMLSGPLY